MGDLSGKFVLRLDPNLHSRLKLEAQLQNKSLNSLVVDKISGLSSDSDTFLRTTIKQVFGNDLYGIVLFGSQARGDAKKNSDIDLLLIIHNQVAVDRFLYTKWDQEISHIIGEQYSPQFVHLPDLKQCSSLWLEVSLEGIILLDTKEEVIKKNIFKIRQMIAEGKYLRKFTHGHPYWVKVEDINAK